MGGAAAVEYYTHNAVLNILGRGRACVGLAEYKPLLQWFEVVNEPWCTLLCVLNAVDSKLH